MLGFSDLQADIAAELIKRGYPVMVFNQRSVAEILQMIRVVGALVGCSERAPKRWRSRLEMDLDYFRERGGGAAAGGRACSSRNGTTR